MTAPLFTCLSCPKFRPSNQAQPANGGRCHAHPPRPIMVGVQNTPLGPQPMFQCHYPQVTKDDYCFEHPHAERMTTRSAMPLLSGARVVDINPAALSPISGSNGKFEGDARSDVESVAAAQE